MKKIICFLLTVTLVLSSTTIAFAKPKNTGKQKQHKITQQDKQKSKTVKQDAKTKQDTKTKKNAKTKKQSFKINGSPVIKYGRYKLPINPIQKGMGATVKFDKETAVLTVEKGTITIVIDFKNKTVTVNGEADTKSGIFTAKNEKKMTVLIQYIAKILGIRTEVDDDEVVVEVPGLDLPSKVEVLPVGSIVEPNTVNTNTLYITASASITPGQATGGKAELYVDSKLVATDTLIEAADSEVTFTTSDETPTNAELQAAIPAGGIVSVKLYNASGKFVTSNIANPTLIVDYAAPAIESITSAVYSVSGSAIYINVTGADAIGDLVDVTKVSLYDATTQKTYQLTNAAEIGSTGEVKNANLIVINLGSVDKLGLSNFGSTSLILNIAPGSFLSDAAGNVSNNFTEIKSFPITVVD